MTARHLCLLCAPLAMVVLSGCGREEEIQQYRVPKPHVVFESNHVDRDAAPGAATSPAARGEAVPTRTLAALVPHGEQTWFFKLTGPDKAVAAREEDFRKLVGSVRFTGPQARPEWTVPEGWTQASGGGEMRFATLQTKSAGESLEATVIPLPSAEGDFDEYVLANVNRWRNQLGLTPIGVKDLPENTTRIELPEGNGEATLVNLAGEAAQGGGPPFAPFAGGQGMRGAAPRSPSQENALLTFDTPEGWSQGRVGGMRKAAFVVEEDEQKVEVTAIDLSAAAGDLLPNVNRWRGQVGLDPVDQKQLMESLRPVEVGSEEGWFVELVGADDAPQPQTILGVIVVHGDRSWFFKLQGDRPLAEREKERFLEFVKSVKFRN